MAWRNRRQLAAKRHPKARLVVTLTPRAAVLLFAQGAVYVGLQATNIVQLARHQYIGAFAVGFLISLLWSWNVKGVAFRSGWGGVTYAAGAAVGTVIGMTIGGWL